MHHESFIETLAVQWCLPAILYMDHRGLAERGQQLVRRVRGKHQRRVRAACSAHAVTPLIELMERRIGVPGFVEVQYVNTVTQRLLDALGVVAQAVIGGVGNYRQADPGSGRVNTTLPGQRAGGNLGGQRRRGELIKGNRPDDAQLVAGGCQVQRHSPGHDDRVEDRLVAVAIDQHQIVTTDHGVPDDLVRRGGAVDHEEAVVGPKITCGTHFGLRQWAGVIE